MQIHQREHLTVKQSNPIERKTQPKFAVTACISILILTACQNWETVVKLPEPLRGPLPASAAAAAETPSARSKQAGTADLSASTERPGSTTFTETPGTLPPPSMSGLDSSWEEKPPALKGGPFKLNIDNMPLPAFINEVYGNMLQLSFQIDKSLQSSRDLVTVRIAEPRSAQDLWSIVGKILLEYGVMIKKEQGRYLFLQSSHTPIAEPPLLVSGRTLPEVPVSHRPVFQIVPLINVRNTTVTGPLHQIYESTDLKIEEDAEQNTIILRGPQNIVRNAVETIQFLDQPAMRGRYSLRIDPSYQPADTLGDALVEILQTEGYGASTKPPIGSVFVLPMSKINALIVFTADAQLLEHIKEWAQALDKPSRARNNSTMFYYQVKNTSAKDLAKTLTPLVPSITTAQASNQPKGSAPQPGQAVITSTLSSQQANLVVDEQRNAILFFGLADIWSELLPIIRQMDTPSKQVMIEVTIAEVTLGDTDKFGIEWLISGKIGQYNFDMGTLFSAVSPVAGGLNYILDSGGSTRMVLNALATDNRVNVLSTPRIMVKSGDEAAIEIGNEVPIVTSQGVPSGSPQTGGDSIFTQNIQYRKTGVILKIKPVIHSGRRVDLDLSQELSSAQQNTTSDISSPTILNRKVETTLSLKDGASVLLAGIISDNSSYDSKGVPYLKDLPFIGSLFSTQATTHDKTEIVIMIVPYILEQDADVADLSKTLRERYTFERQPPPPEKRHEIWDAP